MKDLFKAVNNAWYEQYGTVNADIVEFCFDSGFSSWEALENGEEEEEEEEEEPEENNFSRWCNENYPACKGCPYEKLRKLTDCETAYYHDNPDDDDGIRIYR